MDSTCARCHGRGYTHGNTDPDGPPSAMPCPCGTVEAEHRAATAVAHVAAVTGQPAAQLVSSPVTLPDGTPAELVSSSHLRGGPWWLVEVTAGGPVRGVLCRAVDHFDVDGSLDRMLEDYQAGRRTPYGIAACRPTCAEVVVDVLLDLVRTRRRRTRGDTPAAPADPEELAGDGSDPFAGGPPATAEDKRAGASLPKMHAGDLAGGTTRDPGTTF